MSQYFHENEQINPVEREHKLLNRLPAFIDYAKQECPYYAELLANVNADNITSRESLAQLPITRKSELKLLQSNEAIFAGIVSEKATIGRVFQSPGPINEPENCFDDWWRMGQAFYAAGFRKGDIVQNCLSYHLTPGGFILDSGARACGCTVIPAGPGQTEQQLEVIEQLKPSGYCGTPSFLKILLDKAENTGKDTSSLQKALVTGEALPESLRALIKAKGISVLQAYASADIGLIGYETTAGEGFIVAEELIVEIVRPGTLEPVEPGEVGEVVVTSFNADYPLIRFATGDLSAISLGKSSCGRTNQRLKGWLGRADQTTKIKGMFVHPEQIEKVRQQFSHISKMRLTVSQVNHNDTMLLECELDSFAKSTLETEAFIEQIKQSLKQVTKLSGQVSLVPLGTLVNDGKVIDDVRDIS